MLIAQSFCFVLLLCESFFNHFVVDVVQELPAHYDPGEPGQGARWSTTTCQGCRSA